MNTEIRQKINQEFYDKYHLAYICINHSMSVLDVSDNLERYGLGHVKQGMNATEHIDFIIGLDTHSSLELPMVESPSGVPMSVSLLPAAEHMTLLIADASAQAERRRLLQQAANENELLVDQQKKLMVKLQDASNELEIKNQQLQEASRLQTSFLSGVSHEFRTPLTSIIGYTNLIKQGLSSVTDEETDNLIYLSAVHRSSKHLLSLVENLLDHGKLDSDEIVMHPKATDLDELFADVEVLLKPLCVTKHIDFNVNTEFTQQASAMLDSSRLRQCLINLIGNAIKFTDEGGVTVKAVYQQDALQISVDDTGLGISAEDLKKIRLPFWQVENTGKAGTGLGLTITEKIIELMGGELDISSSLGVGTSINFTLPAPSAVPPVIDEKSASFAQKNLSVLLAEDDSDIADLITLMLMEKGVSVTHVANGALAVDAVTGNEFDLVLMDLHMPIMTGYQAIERLRELGNQTPVIVMSASALDNDREQAKISGCDGYLIKPVDVDDILALAQQFVK